MERVSLIILPSLFLTACGGSSDSSSPEPEPQPTEYLVTTSVTEGGSISPESATLLPGASTAFTVTAADGFQIKNVTGCNGELDGSEYTTGNVNRDCTVNARFEPVQISVSGTVSGLDGEITIKLDTSSRNLTEDGTFEFSVNQYSEFEVTVTKEPESQDCSVENGSQQANEDISNITITCADRVTVAEAIDTVADLKFRLCLENTIEETYADDVEVIACPSLEIQSLEGLASFPMIKELSVESNQLTTLDISNNKRLKTVDAWSNNLQTVNTFRVFGLESVKVYDNQLTAIDVSTNQRLEVLNVSFNSLSTLDLSNNANLTEISVSNNALDSLVIADNPELTFINASANNLTSIDVSSNPLLNTLYLSSNNLSELDVTNNPALKNLSASTNTIASIDLSQNTQLQGLQLSGNQLSTIDLSNNPALTDLSLPDNQFVTIDVSQNTGLTLLDLQDNAIASIDVSANTLLSTFILTNNQLSAVNVDSNPSLKVLSAGGNNLNSISLTENTGLEILNLDSNQFAAINVSANPALSELTLANNSFTTVVPTGLTSINDVTAVIDLTGNAFTTSAEDELYVLKETYVNLSFDGYVP